MKHILQYYQVQFFQSLNSQSLQNMFWHCCKHNLQLQEQYHSLQGSNEYNLILHDPFGLSNSIACYVAAKIDNPYCFFYLA